MAYPNPTTYTLPFMDKIRVSSRRRFILVRDHSRTPGQEGKPFVVRRSDALATLLRDYNQSTDYILDQLEGTVMFTFNGKKEVQNV